MKKLIQKIVKRYNAWVHSSLQRKLEIEIGLVLSSMNRALDNLSLYRNCNAAFGRDKLVEAWKALDLGIESLDTCLPYCSEQFQKETLSQIQLLKLLIQFKSVERQSLVA